MTQTVQAAPPPPPRPAADAPAASQDVQRQSLELIVRLSIECTAEEQPHRAAARRGARAGERRLPENHARSVQQRHQRRLAEVTAGAKQRQESTQKRYDARRQAIEAENLSTQKRILHEKEEADSALKKTFEQASWQAEAAQVAVEMQADVDEKKAKKEHETRLTDLSGVEDSVREAMFPYKLPAMPPDPSLDEATKQRLVAEPRVMLEEHRQHCVTLLQELQKLSETRIMAGMLPIGLILTLTALAGVFAWMIPATEQGKLRAAGGAALAVALIGTAILLVYRHREQARVRAKAKDLYLELRRSILSVRRAANLDFEDIAAVRANATSTRPARRKPTTSPPPAMPPRPPSARPPKSSASPSADTAQRYKDQLAAIDQEKDSGLAQVQQERDQTAGQIEQEQAAARQDEETRHTRALETIAADYDRECRTLSARWDDGLRAVSRTPRRRQRHRPPPRRLEQPRLGPVEIAAGILRPGPLRRDESGSRAAHRAGAQAPADPRNFQRPRDAGPADARLAAGRGRSRRPRRRHRCRADGHGAAAHADPRRARQVHASSIPSAWARASPASCTWPITMKSLVGARIWTEAEHIEQRLADLTEHMETVIQKYLRNEYATIDEYNAQAGELAEPYPLPGHRRFPHRLSRPSRSAGSPASPPPARAAASTRIILRDTAPAAARRARAWRRSIARSVHLHAQERRVHLERCRLQAVPAARRSAAGRRSR